MTLILAACSGPAPAPTQTGSAQATATAAPATEIPLPTNTPTVVPATNTPTDVPPTSTPEPTATATAAPRLIDALTIAGLSKLGEVTIPRQPYLLLDDSLSGAVGGYTSDSQHLVLSTGAGVDVLSTATLDIEAHYPGLRLVALLTDGRFAALHGDALVKVAPISGEMETVATEADFSGAFAVSPTGEQVASVVDARTVRLYSLTGAALDIPTRAAPSKVTFTGDGAFVILDFIRTADARFEVYETGAARLSSCTRIPPSRNQGFRPTAHTLCRRMRMGCI